MQKFIRKSEPIKRPEYRVSFIAESKRFADLPKECAARFGQAFPQNEWKLIDEVYGIMPKPNEGNFSIMNRDEQTMQFWCRKVLRKFIVWTHMSANNLAQVANYLGKEPALEVDFDEPFDVDWNDKTGDVRVHSNTFPDLSSKYIVTLHKGRDPMIGAVQQTKQEGGEQPC